jgi:hypothetical protein
LSPYAPLLIAKRTIQGLLSFWKRASAKADDPVAHYRLARVYIELGKKEPAKAEFALHARLTGR